jgi:hypothetical protein
MHESCLHYFTLLFKYSAYIKYVYIYGQTTHFANYPKTNGKLILTRRGGQNGLSLTVSVTEVGTSGDLALNAYTALDNSSFHWLYNNGEGGSVFFFNAKPGATFRVTVAKYLTMNAPNPYLFQAVYHPVPDTHEPNDQRIEAASIGVGQAVEGYMFAGWEASTGIPSTEWEDWYQVELAAGAATILLSVPAADVDGSITLFNTAGTQIAYQYNDTPGGNVQLDYTIVTAGTYYVRVTPYQTPSVDGSTAAVPQYLTVPYTLTVSQ